MRIRPFQSVSTSPHYASVLNGEKISVTSVANWPKVPNLCKTPLCSTRGKEIFLMSLLVQVLLSHSVKEQAVCCICRSMYVL